MKIKKALFLFVFLFGCFFCNLIANASVQKEEILSYHIYAELNQDSSLLVHETIKVRAQGKDIKRGIYRDLPTRYAGEKTPVSIISVTRNGKDIPYTTKRGDNQKRVYLGDMNRYIYPGIYEYKITYKHQNIVRYNEEKIQDVFYYNLICNEWMFNILDVAAIVRLPSGVTLAEEPKVFFGKYGSKNQDTPFLKQDNQILIHLPNGLKKREALSLNVDFDSGFFKIQEPGIPFNKYVNILFIIVILFVFYWVAYYAYFSWKKHGEDGIRRPAYPRFDIPKFNKLGALFFLKNYQCLGIDSCDLIMPHLAYLSQKGLLKIKTDKKGITLEKNMKIKPSNSDEKFFIERAKNKYSLKKGVYSSSFVKYVEEYKQYSEKQTSVLFKYNTKCLLMFKFLMFVFCFCFFMLYFNDFSFLFVSLILGGVTLGFSNVVLSVFTRGKNWIIIAVGVIILTVFLSCFSFLFLHAIYELSDLLLKEVDELITSMADYKVWCFVFLFSCIVAFYKYIIVRVYDKGLDLIEHLEGIEMFLKGTDDLKDKTPEQVEMEKLLPYAILLGLQNQWCEKMETYFNFIPPDDDVFSDASVFSSVSSCLHSASTSHSSSSGGSGGGGSGGGAGGGAGGGGGGGF